MSWSAFGVAEEAVLVSATMFKLVRLSRVSKKRSTKIFDELRLRSLRKREELRLRSLRERRKRASSALRSRRSIRAVGK